MGSIERRQQAIRMRLLHKSVVAICAALRCPKSWFYKWWSRYQAQGVDGLRDVSRAPHSSPSRVADEIRQMIVAIRDRLMHQRGAAARYRLIGAPTIREELRGLGYQPLPALRTIDLVLQQAGRTNPAIRLQAPCRAGTYPEIRATHSNQVHQFDLVGPRYLKGRHTRYYFLVYKDVYDLSVYVEFQPAPSLSDVLNFVVRAWQQVGLPDLLQVDNGWVFAGTGRWPRSLNRFIRLALRVGVELVFIPEGEPCHNGSVENFNGWFQPRLFSIQLSRPAQVRRELVTLMEVCNTEHIHPQLAYRTARQVRQHQVVRRLPANFAEHQQAIPVAVGRVTFLRRVRPSGRITVLKEKIRVGKRLKGQYVRATLFTRIHTLKVYARNKLIKVVDYPIRGSDN